MGNFCWTKTNYLFEMSHTHPEEAHGVKKGHLIMLKGKPCKIAEVKTSKTGKHGHAKCNITGMDVHENRKINDVFPGHIVLAAFDQQKNDWEVVGITDDVCEVMDEDGKVHEYDLTPQSGEVYGKVHQELIAAVAEAEESGSDVIYQAQIVTAPRGDKDPQLHSIIVGFKVAPADD